MRVNGSDPQQTILVIEDEPDVVDLLALSLRKAGGFTLIVANDGVTGLKKARTEKPALVVLDLMLPGMSGLEVCKLLKSGSVAARIPILMHSAGRSDAQSCCAMPRASGYS